MTHFLVVATVCCVCSLNCRVFFFFVDCVICLCFVCEFVCDVPRSSGQGRTAVADCLEPVKFINQSIGQ